MTSQADRTSGELDWPAHLERTPAGERERTSKFSVTFHKAISDIGTELEDRVGVDDWRVSTAAPHRKKDGMPYSNASPDDPGVVIRWSMDGDQYAVACDQYSSWRDNARAIGLYIAEKRKMQDRPVTTGQSEFATAQLPPADEDAVAAPPARSSNGMSDQEARDVLGVTEGVEADVIKAVARRRSANLHPDGDSGDEAEFKRIQKAKRTLLE